MTWLLVVLAIWLVAGGLFALWLAAAVRRNEATQGRRPDPTSCACCGHDRIAHRIDGVPGACTRCPCRGCRALRPGRVR